MLNVKRIRYVITKEYKGEMEIMCGLARNYHFKKIDEVGTTAIKTYHSRKKAESAFLRSWRHWSLDDIEVVEVLEQYTSALS